MSYPFLDLPDPRNTWSNTKLIVIIDTGSRRQKSMSALSGTPVMGLSKRVMPSAQIKPHKPHDRAHAKNDIVALPFSATELLTQAAAVCGHASS